MKYPDDPVACIPLDDLPDPQVRDWVVVNKSLFEEPDPGRALNATLRDSIFVGMGDTVPEALESLACDLEQRVKAIRARAKEMS